MDIFSKWWSERRRTYNMGLIAAGILSFIAYAILGTILIMPYDNSFEITLFTIIFQGIGFLIMLAVANVFYFLGPFVDRIINKNREEKISRLLFNLGFGFSIFLLFLIPIMLVVQYFVE